MWRRKGRMRCAMHSHNLFSGGLPKCRPHPVQRVQMGFNSRVLAPALSHRNPPGHGRGIGDDPIAERGTYGTKKTDVLQIATDVAPKSAGRGPGVHTGRSADQRGLDDKRTRGCANGQFLARARRPYP